MRLSANAIVFAAICAVSVLCGGDRLVGQYAHAQAERVSHQDSLAAPIRDVTLFRQGFTFSVPVREVDSVTDATKPGSNDAIVRIVFSDAARKRYAPFSGSLVGERVSGIVFNRYAMPGLRNPEPIALTVLHLSFGDWPYKDGLLAEFSSAKSDPSRQDEVFISFIQDVMSVSPEDDELVLTVRPGQAPVLTLPIPEAVADNIAHGALAPDDWLLVADEWIVTFTRIERIGDAMHITLSGDNPTRPWPVDAGIDDQ